MPGLWNECIMSGMQPLFASCPPSEVPSWLSTKSPGQIKTAVQRTLVVQRGRGGHMNVPSCISESTDRASLTKNSVITRITDQHYKVYQVSHLDVVPKQREN